MRDFSQSSRAQSSAQDKALARALLTPNAVRQRAGQLYALAQQGRLLHFDLHTQHMAATADFVLETTLAAYPNLDIPFHARWRHFGAGGRDRWAALEHGAGWKSAQERAIAAIDLTIVSVLLDAGSGPHWSYREADGTRSTRSEGLGIASLDMFAAGLFSSDLTNPLKVDARKLGQLSVAELAAGFQAGPHNPLAGLEGRAALLVRLGEVIAANPVFADGQGARPGGLFHHLAAQAVNGHLPALAILEAVLTHLGPVWPDRLALAGVSLGDTWRHPLVEADDLTNGLVPFHKLSQWLSYSLIEPLQAAGLTITNVDGLTGLPEYRNGGLFLDMGVLTLRDPAQAAKPHEAGSPLVVEWRALTIVLLDEIAALLRKKLGLDAASLPLAKVLEGGTWAAGRRIAGMRRKGGLPPLNIVSDGTVF